MLLINQTKLMEKLDISRGTIWRWRRDGLPCIQRGRFIRYDFDQVVEWLRKNKEVHTPNE